MILYFDNYITDTPLVKGLYSDLDRVRDSHPAYKMPGKLNISKYTLASYAKIDWSAVVIKYSIEDSSKTGEFEAFVKSIFDKPVIIRGRSDSQGKFAESVKTLKQFDDEWIFYCGNNDHPFTSHERETLDNCMQMCKKHAQKSEFVSMAYSHFPESINAPYAGTRFHDITCPEVSVLEENEHCVASLFPNGAFDSVQMVNLSLLERWFCTGDLSNRRVIRSVSIAHDVPVSNQVVVAPKKEICTHFDGYGHTAKLSCPLPYEKFPPLFIPQGFFESKMKIAYGYENYRQGWTNINPQAKDYCFVDAQRGTDSKIGASHLPLFWQDKISETDINPSLDTVADEKATVAELELRRHPWPKISRFSAMFYRMRNKANSVAKYAPLVPKMLMEGKAPDIRRDFSRFTGIGRKKRSP